MSYHSPEEINKIKEEQRIRTTETVKTGVRLYFGFVGKVFKFTCLGIFGIVGLILLGFLLVYIISGINQASQVRQNIIQQNVQQTSYANQQKNSSPIKQPEATSTPPAILKAVEPTSTIQAATLGSSQSATNTATATEEPLFPISTIQAATIGNLQSTTITLTASGDAQNPTKYDISGKWDWNVANQWSGFFIITQTGNTFSGTLDDTSVNLHGDKIVNGKITGDQVEFTRDGYYGLQKWTGTITVKDGRLNLDGDCQGAGKMHAVKE